MNAPSFLKVLTGALCGAMLGAAAWMAATGKGGLERLSELPMVFMAYPVGAILGMRVAAGRGGTARWVVLVGSYLVWCLSAWLMRNGGGGLWFFGSGQMGSWLSLPVLLGGWAALVWRSLARLSGEAGAPGLLASNCFGLWVSELLWMGAVWLIGFSGRFSFLPSGAEGLNWLVFVVVPTALAVILVLALGSLGSLTGNLDIPWAKASLAAVLIGEATAVSRVLASLAGWEWWPWVFPVQWLVFRVAWFAWWAHRLTRESES